MAKPKVKNETLTKAEGGSLADLIGNSIAIKLPDGSSLIVPADKAGNRIANMIAAAEVRHAIQAALKKYRDQDMLPTPKDLKDMADATATLAKFSGDIYKDDDATLPTEPKKTSESKPKAADEVSFDEAVAPKAP